MTRGASSAASWAQLTARGRARAARAVFSVTQAAGDFLAPPVRYGTFRTATKLMLRRSPMAAVPAPPPAAVPVPDVVAAAGRAPRVALVADGLDSGGVEAVVSLLARRLPGHGLSADVVCAKGGRVAEFLRGAGVRVVEASSVAQAERALAALSPDVIQLHSAPGPLVEAARAHGAPLVPVVHNTELFRSSEDWALQSALADQAVATVAVSEFVAAQHCIHLHRPPRGPVVVVPNGVPTGTALDVVERDVARRQVGAVLGVDLADDALALCLGRWDPQKNLPGLVAGFVEVARLLPAPRLVVAGGVQDWLEFSKADALRRSSGVADRIHLLTVSHTPTLLAAADVFVLDSFFEGWPVAATEAAVGGLPLVLADVGGARELVGEGGARGVAVPNPAAGGLGIDARSIRKARRALVQRNRRDLVDAVAGVCDEIDDWRSRRAVLAADASERFDEAPMVAAHARVLHEALVGART